MLDIYDNLDYSYRIDEYNLVDTTQEEKETEKYSEFFVVAGEHSFIQIPNFDYGFCYVHIHGVTFAYSLGSDMQDFMMDYELLQEKRIKQFNAFREQIMLYDYCLTELRKIKSIKEAVKSPLFEVKKMLENVIADGDYNARPSNSIINKSLIAKLNLRCEYLSYAYGLEWDGIVNLETVRKFDKINDLEDYIDQYNLEDFPEDVDKNVDLWGFTEINNASGDLLCNIRKVENETERYAFVEDEVQDEKRVGKIKNGKTVSLTGLDFIKEKRKAYKFLNSVIRIGAKLESTTSNILKGRYEKAKERTTEKFLEQGVHLVLLDTSDDVCSFEK